MTIRLPGFIFRNLDSASMSHSLEARVPFVDHEFVEFCAKIPPWFKMRFLNEKFILRTAMQELPAEIAWRKKRGLMSPLSQWLGNLPDSISNILSESEIRAKGYFDPEVIPQMLALYRDGNTIYDKSLMCVLSVHLWDELFVKEFSGMRVAR